MRKLPFLLLLTSRLAFAACTGSSPTWTSTPDQASVASCLSSASRGDTINVSAGSATWSSGVTITKGVTLTGAGVGSTVITSSGGITFITATPDSTAIANEEHIKITGFEFDGANSTAIFMLLSGASGITGTKPYRYYIIGNNKFKNQVSGSSEGVLTATSGNGNGEMSGVIYSNDFDRTNITIRVFSNNDTAEAENAAFRNPSFGSSDGLYFESNTIHWSSSYTGGDAGWSETGQGGRLVMRYNSYNFTNVTGMSELSDAHGFQGWPGGNTGTVLSERYGNTYTGFGGYRCLNYRGGKGLAFDNVETGSNCSYAVYGESATNFCPASISPTPVNYNPLLLAWFWNNTVNGSQKLTASEYGGSFSCTVAENNGNALGTVGSSSEGGWWNYNASCTASSCSAGVGTGTSTPTGTCTKGTAFWKAAVSGVTTTPSEVQAGALYTCTATNTWTQTYTPYTYPHPLIGGAPATFSTSKGVKIRGGKLR